MDNTLYLILLLAHLQSGYFTQAETIHQCIQQSPNITLTCPEQTMIIVTQAIVGTSSVFRGGLPECPFDDTDCYMTIPEPSIECNDMRTCDLEESIINQNLMNNCFATNFIRINYTCDPVTSHTMMVSLTTSTPDDDLPSQQPPQRPPHASPQPPKDGTQPHDDSTQPPDDSTQSPDDSTQSPDDSTQSPVDNTQSPVDSTQSHVDSTQSPDDGTQSPKDHPNIGLLVGVLVGVCCALGVTAAAIFVVLRRKKKHKCRDHADGKAVLTPTSDKADPEDAQDVYETVTEDNTYDVIDVCDDDTKASSNDKDTYDVIMDNDTYQPRVDGDVYDVIIVDNEVYNDSSVPVLNASDAIAKNQGANPVLNDYELDLVDNDKYHTVVDQNENCLHNHSPILERDDIANNDTESMGDAHYALYDVNTRHVDNTETMDDIANPQSKAQDQTSDYSRAKRVSHLEDVSHSCVDGIDSHVIQTGNQEIALIDTGDADGNTNSGYETVELIEQM